MLNLFRTNQITTMQTTPARLHITAVTKTVIIIPNKSTCKQNKTSDDVKHLKTNANLFGTFFVRRQEPLRARLPPCDQRVQQPASSHNVKSCGSSYRYYAKIYVCVFFFALVSKMHVVIAVLTRLSQKVKVACAYTALEQIEG